MVIVNYLPLNGRDKLHEVYEADSVEVNGMFVEIVSNEEEIVGLVQASLIRSIIINPEEVNLDQEKV